MSRESWNKRHGLPKDAGIKESAEYLIRTSKNPEVVAQAKDHLRRLEAITRPVKPIPKVADASDAHAPTGRPPGQ